MLKLSHLDGRGQAVMVDVGGKPVTHRYARAWGRLSLAPATLRKITSQQMAKGDVFGAARLAGIMAAKRTGELIPLCHPLPLSYVGVELVPLFSQSAVVIVAEAALAGQTGIEMEALTAVTMAGLTVYDMCKAIDKSMSLSAVALLEKKGGRSGHYIAAECSRLLAEVDRTELDSESLVFWRGGARGELEFHLEKANGPLLARAAGGADLLSLEKCSAADKVVVLGSCLLRAESGTAAGNPERGCLQVVKPGVVDAEALFAVLG
ncbi:MAG: cyclic pyranopterin monophosphate synthase MoaC [Deltaproteobacteria bacterium]|nr:cyclic pyranopterin monophosphate synthase MoaC [Deltaproteobacteria bacterium]